MFADGAPLMLRFRLMPADSNAYVAAVRWTFVERAVRPGSAVGFVVERCRHAAVK